MRGNYSRYNVTKQALLRVGSAVHRGEAGLTNGRYMGVEYESLDIPEHTSLVALVADESGRLVAWTASAESALGAAAGKPLAQLRFPGASESAFAASLEEAASSCLSTGQPVSLAIELPPGQPIGGPLTAIAMPIATTLAEKAVSIVLIPGRLGEHAGVSAAAEEDAGPSPDQIIAEVAHELSRPLASVLNYTELALQDPDLPEPARLRMEMVVHQAEMCQAAVRRFLQVGRPAPESIQAVDLNQVVRQAVTSLEPSIAESRVQIALDLDEALPRIAGNPQDVEAVVRNLLENALHAAAQSAEAPCVRIKTGHNASRVTVTTTDNGPGIAPSIGDRVFEPFFTTREPGRGAGLGLSISRRIVQEHGGRISLASEPGQGATFTIDLPVGDLPARVPQPAAEPSPAAATGTPTAPARALVVEDDVSMRKLLAAYLEGMGYETVEAEDGKEALERCRASSFDVIVCDVKMPEMNGAEFYRSLLETSPEQAPRVIFSTGVLPIDGNNAFLRSLPNPRLQKPFRLASLRQAIQLTGGAVRQR